MKILKLLPLLLLSAIVLPSCNNNDDPQANTQAVVISADSSTVASYNRDDQSLDILPGAIYGVLVNLDNSTLQLSVANLQYDGNQQAISFSLPELRLGMSQTGWLLDHAEPISVQTQSGTATISKLQVNFALRANGAQNVVRIYMVLDDKYELTTIFNNSQFIGTTTSTDITDPADNPFTTDLSQYLVVIDRQKKTAQVQIANPKFLDNMPSNLGIMIFDNIPLTFSADGYTFSTSNLIPKIGKDPYPAFEISNLQGSVIAGKSLSLTFDCAKFNRKVTVAGTAY